MDYSFESFSSNKVFLAEFAVTSTLDHQEKKSFYSLHSFDLSAYKIDVYKQLLPKDARPECRVWPFS